MMFSKKRQIDPAIRRRLRDLPEAIIRAKLLAIADVTSLADQDRRPMHERPVDLDLVYKTRTKL
jgi:hypothetical protein